MKIEEFKAGERRSCYQYECFVPSFVNHDWSWDSQELTLALERAVKGLAGLDACSQFVPDIDLFIRMHIVREASASSRIEGTQTEMEEAILPEESIVEERRNDWREVNNYIGAMNWAVDELKRLPIHLELAVKSSNGFSPCAMRCPRWRHSCRTPSWRNGRSDTFTVCQGLRSISSRRH